MKMSIPKIDFPEDVEISTELIEEERPQIKEHYNPIKRTDENAPGPAFHEKKDKNKKENLGGSYKFKIAAKYKKPKTRGDKNYNTRNKKQYQDAVTVFQVVHFKILYFKDHKKGI